MSALQRRVYEETGMSMARFYVIWPEIKETLRVDRNERGKYRRGGLNEITVKSGEEPLHK